MGEPRLPPSNGDACGRYAAPVTVKEQLRQAVDAMSEEEARTALRTLADASGDPVAWMLAHAPLDDEPETQEERDAVEEARHELASGAAGVPLDEVKRELGLA
jgi:hypothetical protein